jgi:outer membrane protein OmpA-like peptidoglycan-associated protein
MVKRIIVTSCLSAGFILSSIFGQKPVTIKLDNPSFEDYPQAAHVPQGWADCGFPNESPPDVQPNGTFKVSKIASHGSTYIGMVVRDVNTWEAMGQRLKTPLLKGAVYTFSLDLARSELYESQSQATKKTVNYITPVTIRIWGGSGYCAKNELLDETEPVSSSAWKKYAFKFNPKMTHTHIMIEAFYKVPTLFPYNGNILMDNASDIVPETEKPLVVAKIEPKKTSSTAVKPSAKQPKNPDTPATLAEAKPKETPKSIPTKPKEKEPVIEEESPLVKSGKLKEGQIMKIERLQFKPNSSVIETDSYSQMDKIYAFLSENPTLVVEIGGHSNLLVGDELGLKLSTERAKAVAEYLSNKGIDKSRLVTKGYGKSRPLINESSAAANKENQRVELKILSING